MTSGATGKVISVLIKINVILTIIVVYILCNGGKYSDRKHDKDLFQLQSSELEANFNHLRSRYRRLLMEMDRKSAIEPSDDEWIYHRKKVEYLHPDVALLPTPNSKISKNVNTGKMKEFGVFAVDRIPFGTVISAEYPILNIDEGQIPIHFDHLWQKMSYFHRMIQRHSDQDSEFKRFWNKMPIDPVLKHQFAAHLRKDGHSFPEHTVDDYLRFLTNKFGNDAATPWAVYSVMDRVGFNLPQNVMIVIGGKENEYKAVLITTRDIEKGEDIVLDRAFEVNEKWIAFLNQLQDKSSSQRDKEKMLLKLYPNGFLGKNADGSLSVIGGCDGIVKDPKDCSKKLQIEEDIHSGAIFDLTVILKFYGKDGAANLNDSN